MFYRLRTYRIILRKRALSGNFRVFDHFQDGKVEHDTEQFFELEEIARAHLGVIKQMAGGGALAKLKRHIALSKLNALLSFYGWAIRRDGQLYEVRVRGETINLKLDETPQHPTAASRISTNGPASST